MKKYKLDETEKAWSMSIGQLSHALATKMATLQMKQQGLQKIIPSLLKGYHLAVEHHLIEDTINAKMLNRIEDMQNLDEQLMPMFELLEQLNTYCSQMVGHDAIEMQRLSAQQCLSALLANYTFEQDSQRNRIALDLGHDFEFKCPILFIESSLRHILTITLQHISKSNEGSVRIWLSDEAEYHLFNIKLIDQNLNEAQMTACFNHFLFEPYDKTRPGLGFCRLAIQHLGGNVICHSVYGEYTLFKIMLPMLPN